MSKDENITAICAYIKAQAKKGVQAIDAFRKFVVTLQVMKNREMCEQKVSEAYKSFPEAGIILQDCGKKGYYFGGKYIPTEKYTYFLYYYYLGMAKKKLKAWLIRNNQKL